MEEVKLHFHVVYILWLYDLYVFYSLYLLYSISFLSLSDNSSLEANVICWLWPTWNKVYLILSYQTLTLVWFWISTPNFSGTILMYMGRSLLIFSDVNFKMAAWHAFSRVTQVYFGISVSNFMCMSFVAVGRSLVIFSYVAFKMVALRFWTMFNCNPPIAPCYPLLWGGGILVDHWSTISSSSYQATSKGVSRVMFLAKFEILAIFENL